MQVGNNKYYTHFSELPVFRNIFFLTNGFNLVTLHGICIHHGKNCVKGKKNPKNNLSAFPLCFGKMPCNSAKSLSGYLYISPRQPIFLYMCAHTSAKSTGTGTAANQYVPARKGLKEEKSADCCITEAEV